ncbi:MAG: hypothetical protein AVDCRST_MAG41-1515, partial [uncultured Corynebacteriales bacterium]
ADQTGQAGGVRGDRRARGPGVPRGGVHPGRLALPDRPAGRRHPGRAGRGGGGGGRRGPDARHGHLRRRRQRVRGDRAGRGRGRLPDARGRPGRPRSRRGPDAGRLVRAPGRAGRRAGAAAVDAAGDGLGRPALRAARLRPHAGAGLDPGAGRPAHHVRAGAGPPPV